MFLFSIPRNFIFIANFSLESVGESSSSATKFSRHLIFQTKDPFLDNLAVGRFINLIIEDIQGCLINHHCSAIPKASSNSIEQSPLSTESAAFAKKLFSILEARLSLFRNCRCIDDYSELPMKDLAEFLVKKSDQSGSTWFCDTGKTNLLEKTTD